MRHMRKKNIMTMTNRTLIERQEPLLKAALKKIENMDAARALFADRDPKYFTDTIDQLTKEYDQIIRELIGLSGELRPPTVELNNQVTN